MRSSRASSSLQQKKNLQKIDEGYTDAPPSCPAGLHGGCSAGFVPRPDLQFPGFERGGHGGSRDWYHWPLVFGGRLTGEALVHFLWTASGIAAWRPLKHVQPEEEFFRRILCLETLSPVPGVAAWLNEYVQSLITSGESRWHLTSPCVLEVEDRRTRLLTWLGLAKAATPSRLACLFVEAAYLPVLMAALFISPTFSEAVVSHVDQHVARCYRELYDRVNGGDLALWAASSVPHSVSRMWGLEDSTSVGVLLRLMLDAPIGERSVGCLPSPSSGPPSEILPDPIQLPLKELHVTLNVPSTDSDRAFSDAQQRSIAASGRNDWEPAAFKGDKRRSSENTGKRNPLRKRGSEKAPDKLLKKMDQLWGAY
eukprot:jgi/Botrbrau1/14697/Bobra.0108s0051.1